MKPKNLLALKLNKDEIRVIGIGMSLAGKKRPIDEIEVLFANRDDVYKYVIKLVLSIPSNVEAQKSLLRKIDTARQREVDRAAKAKIEEAKAHGSRHPRPCRL